MAENNPTIPSEPKSRLRQYIELDPDILPEERGTVEEQLIMDPNKLRQYLSLDQDMNEEEKGLAFSAIQDELKPPAPTWTSVITNTPRQAWGQVLTGVGGIVQAGGELLGGTGETGKSLAQTGQEYAKPLPGTTPTQQFASDVLSSTMAMAPSMLGGAGLYAKGFKLLGSTLPLAYAGTQAGGAEYAEARKKGYSPGEAITAAVPVGVNEALWEKLPVDYILKGMGGKSVLRAMVGAGLREAPTEIATTLGQRGIETITDSIFQKAQNGLYPKFEADGVTPYTAGSLVRESLYSGAVGFGMGSLTGGVAHPFSKASAQNTLAEMDARLNQDAREAALLSDDPAVQEEFNQTVKSRNDFAAEWGFPEFKPTEAPVSEITTGERLAREAGYQPEPTRRPRTGESDNDAILQGFLREEEAQEKIAPTIEPALTEAKVDVVDGAEGTIPVEVKYPNLGAWVDQINQEMPAPLRTKKNQGANVPPTAGGPSTMGATTNLVGQALRDLELLQMERDQVLQQIRSDEKTATPADRMEAHELWTRTDEQIWDAHKKLEKEQFMSKIAEAVRRGIVDGPAIIEFAKQQTDLRPVPGNLWAKKATGEVVEGTGPAPFGETGFEKPIVTKVKTAKTQETKFPTPIADAIRDLGGILPRTKPQAVKTLYEDAPSPSQLGPRGIKKVFGNGKMTVDRMAEHLHSMGLISDSWTTTLWESLKKEFPRGGTKGLDNLAEQMELRAAEEGAKLIDRISTQDLAVGDSFQVNGETFRVTEESDTALRLKDGTEFWMPFDPQQQGGQISIDKGTLTKGATNAQALRENEGQVRQDVAAVQGQNQGGENLQLNAQEKAVTPETQQQAQEAVTKPPASPRRGGTDLIDPVAINKFIDKVLDGAKELVGIKVPQTETEAFKRWFGDSKVVDENGKPLVVYHGTDAKFDAFRKDKPTWFYTKDSSYAEEYGKMPRQINAFLAIKKPFVTNAMENIFEKPYSKEYIAKLKAKGYDGIFSPNFGMYVAFDPTQIKSATGNRGTFDPKNPNILYSAEYLVAEQLAKGAKWLGTKLEGAYRSAVDFASRGLDYFRWAKDAVTNFGADVMRVARDIWRSAISGLKQFLSVPGGLIAQRRGAVGTPNISAKPAAELADQRPITAEQIETARKEYGGLKGAEQEKGREAGLSDAAARTKYVTDHGRMEEFLKNVATPEQARQLLATMDWAEWELNPQKQGATREQIEFLKSKGLKHKVNALSWEEQDMLGRFYGRNWEEIVRTRIPGQSLSVADRARINATLDTLIQLHKAATKIANDSPNDATAQARVSWLQKAFSTVANVRTGDFSDAGRALQFAKKMGIAERNEAKWQKMLEGGQFELSKTQADVINSLRRDDPHFMDKARRILNVNWFDKLYEVWMSSVLSGIKTNSRNVLSNIASLGGKVAESFLAAGLETTPGVEKTGRSFSDPWHIVNGYWNAFQDAGRLALRSFMEGDTNTIKYDNPAIRAMWDTPEGTTAVKGEMFPKAIEGKLGFWVRWPMNGLRAMDIFFRTMASFGHLNMEAHRSAKRAGIDPAKELSRYKNYINDFVTNPTPQALEAAAKEGAYRVFAEKRDAPILRAIYQIKSAGGIQGRLAQFLLPFVKTPYNILAQGFERSPLGFINAFRKLGLDPEKGGIKPSELADELAKPLLGSIVMGMAINMVLQGALTGAGPRDKNKRDQWFAKGNIPYSLTVGGKKFSLDSMEPLFGTTMAMVVDVAEALLRVKNDPTEENIISEGLYATLGAITKNVHNKTFLRGLFSATDAIADPDRYVPSFMENQARGIVPFSGLLRSLGTMADATRYRVDSPADSTASIFPTLSAKLGYNLIPQYDWLGRIVTSKPAGDWGGPMFDAIWRGVSPIEYGKISTDPVDVMAEALEVNRGRPTETVTRDGKTFKLPPMQAAEYIKLQGQFVYQYLKDVARNVMPSLPQASPARKKALSDRLGTKISAIRRKVLDRLMVKWKQEGSIK